MGRRPEPLGVALPPSTSTALLLAGSDLERVGPLGEGFYVRAVASPWMERHVWVRAGALDLVLTIFSGFLHSESVLVLACALEKLGPKYVAWM